MSWRGATNAAMRLRGNASSPFNLLGCRGDTIHDISRPMLLLCAISAAAADVHAAYAYVDGFVANFVTGEGAPSESEAGALSSESMFPALSDSKCSTRKSNAVWGAGNIEVEHRGVCCTSHHPVSADFHYYSSPIGSFLGGDDIPHHTRRAARAAELSLRSGRGDQILMHEDKARNTHSPARSSHHRQTSRGSGSPLCLWPSNRPQIGRTWLHECYNYFSCDSKTDHRTNILTQPVALRDAACRGHHGAEQNVQDCMQEHAEVVFLAEGIGAEYIGTHACSDGQPNLFVLGCSDATADDQKRQLQGEHACQPLRWAAARQLCAAEQQQLQHRHNVASGGVAARKRWFSAALARASRCDARLGAIDDSLQQQQCTGQEQPTLEQPAACALSPHSSFPMAEGASAVLAELTPRPSLRSVDLELASSHAPCTAVEVADGGHTGPLGGIARTCLFVLGLVLCPPAASKMHHHRGVLTLLGGVVMVMISRFGTVSSSRRGGRGEMAVPSVGLRRTLLLLTLLGGALASERPDSCPADSSSAIDGVMVRRRTNPDRMRPASCM